MPHDAKDALAVIPWYWRDWRASKARAVLISDPAAVMAYRELLDAMWGEEGCALPGDDASLAALAGVTPRTWDRVKEKVLRFLPALDDGRRTHPRSKHEYEKANAYREGCRAGGRNRAASMTPERRSEVARQGASARHASKGKQNPAWSMLGSACTPSPSPSPSPSPNQNQNPELSGGPDRAVSNRPPGLPPIVEAWNRAAIEAGAPRVTVVGTKRQQTIRAALKDEPDVARWESAFRLVAADRFLQGGNDRGKVYGDFDFAIRPDQRAKWLDLARSDASLVASAEEAHNAAILDGLRAERREAAARAEAKRQGVAS